MIAGKPTVEYVVAANRGIAQYFIIRINIADLYRFHDSTHRDEQFNGIRHS